MLGTNAAEEIEKVTPLIRNLGIPRKVLIPCLDKTVSKDESGIVNSLNDLNKSESKYCDTKVFLQDENLKDNFSKIFSEEYLNEMKESQECYQKHHKSQKELINKQQSNSQQIRQQQHLTSESQQQDQNVNQAMETQTDQQQLQQDQITPQQQQKTKQHQQQQHQQTKQQQQQHQSYISKSAAESCNARKSMWAAQVELLKQESSSMAADIFKDSNLVLKDDLEAGCCCLLFGSVW